MHRDAETGVELMMNRDGFGWVAVLAAHEPARSVGADGDEGDIGCAEALADIAEKGRIETGVADEVEHALAEAQEKSAPKPTATFPAETVAPVLRRRERDVTVGADDVFFPPVEFDDFVEAGALHQACVGERDDRRRLVALGDAAERWQIAVIVMVVADEDGVDFRQVVERDAWRMNAVRSKQAEGADLVAVNGIDQQCALSRAEQEGGVIDPGDREGAGWDGGKCLRRDFNVIRPRRGLAGASPFEQIAERGQGGCARQKKSAAITVIGLGHAADF